MNARLTTPTRLLHDPDKAKQLDYVPSYSTDLRAKWQSFFEFHARPVTAESYARDQMAEHETSRFQNER